MNANSEYDYDLIVIGSGPGGQKAAIQGLKLGKRVAIVDAHQDLGGNCLHDGTIPSKSFREAIVHLAGHRQREHYGRAYRVKDNITMNDLTERSLRIRKDLAQTIKSQLRRNHADTIVGFASFIDQNRIKVSTGNTEHLISGEFIVIATGTRPRRPETFEFDDQVIMDSDAILRMNRVPRSLCIVGGGVIGCEYGSMFAALDVKVTIVEQRETILGFVDRELIEAFMYKLRESKTSIITNDKVIRCGRAPDGRAVTYLESGKRIVTEKLLVSAGRVPNVESLSLDEVGVEIDERNRIVVNEHFQTNVENIFAVGDVIGAPALAATAMEQGRKATAHAFGMANLPYDIPIPYGIYSVPEIAMVGKTEAELSQEKIPYEFGIGRFSELERGKIIGDTVGVLKILFHRNTLQILGVHIIGEGATELIHIGQTVMGFQGSIDYLVNAVFNYPTLAQAYKTAALDGMNKIVSTQGLPDEVPDAHMWN